MNDIRVFEYYSMNNKLESLSFYANNEENYELMVNNCEDFIKNKYGDLKVHEIGVIRDCDFNFCLSLIPENEIPNISLNVKEVEWS